MWGIQIGKVDGRIKAEGVGVEDEVADDATASTADITALDSDEEGSDSSDDETGAVENGPCKGPAKIMCGGDGTSARALADEEERRLEEEATRRKTRRGDENRDESMPSTEVVKNRRHNK